MGFLSGLFGSDKSAKNAAAKAEADEKARQARINQGLGAIDQKFGSFTDAWFNQRAGEYFDAAMPTLNMEFARTKNNLAFGLAGRGLLNSSIYNQRRQSLDNEMMKQKRIVADTGIGQANDLRMKLEDARSRITSQLYQSADPAQATAAANRETANLSQPSPMGAIGNFFNDWSNVFMTNQIARAENPNTLPLWGSFSGKGSSKIVK
jgi:hypothetical protein